MSPHSAALRPASSRLDMPSLPDASLSALASPLSPATAANVTLSIIGLVLVVATLYYASPTRLTRVLSDATVSTVGLRGLLSPEDMQILVSTCQMLRVEVGKVQTETLHNFFACCPFAIPVIQLLLLIPKCRFDKGKIQDHPVPTSSVFPCTFVTLMKKPAWGLKGRSLLLLRCINEVGIPTVPVKHRIRLRLYGLRNRTVTPLGGPFTVTV
ncbi:hypothetical protein B0H16DRAFT_1819477 [Mycena metata]|uniref:Uncharacterized protein n=1 Tax=Mycena metata TaxID=1033252 RepID=A0AAD7J7X7_9AGAR|nr:hypothetical protein B0H16DRAFT_1819477 [Mycena metata]